MVNMGLLLLLRRPVDTGVKPIKAISAKRRAKIESFS